MGGGDIFSMIFVKNKNGVAMIQVGGGNGNPLQYSCLENPIDRGTWRAEAHGVTKGQTRLKRLSTSTHRVQAPTAQPGVQCGCGSDTSCIAESLQFSNCIKLKDITGPVQNNTCEQRPPATLQLQRPPPILT